MPSFQGSRKSATAQISLRAQPSSVTRMVPSVRRVQNCTPKLSQNFSAAGRVASNRLRLSQLNPTLSRKTVERTIETPKRTKGIQCYSEDDYNVTIKTSCKYR